MCVCVRVFVWVTVVGVSTWCSGALRAQVCLFLFCSQTGWVCVLKSSTVAAALFFCLFTISIQSFPLGQLKKATYCARYSFLFCLFASVGQGGPSAYPTEKGMAEKKKDTVHDLLPGPGEDSAFKPKPEKTCCGGVGPDVFVIFMHAVLLGIDYTILLSASAQYYAHLLLGDSAHDNVTASPLDVNHTTLNVSDGFCEPGSSKSDSLYSEQQSYWALAQLVGCICGIFLPKLVGYKGSFLMFTSMIFLGNLLYALSTVQLLDSWRLAMTGRIISGLGDGSIVLGLSYIPLRIKKIPIMRTALVNYRMYVAVGTTIGSILSIGASRLTDPTTAEIDADFSFNPANIAGFLMSLLALLLFVCEAVLVAPFKPPTQRGAVCSPHWSWKILAWLFFVFTYGMLMGAIQYVCLKYLVVSQVMTTPARCWHMHAAVRCMMHAGTFSVVAADRVLCVVTTCATGMHRLFSVFTPTTPQISGRSKPSC